MILYTIYSFEYAIFCNKYSLLTSFYSSITLLCIVLFGGKVLIYVCEAGRILWRVGTKHEKTASGFVSEKAVYRCESCADCPYKQNCTKAKAEKTLTVSHQFYELRSESQANITTEFGKQLRMNRSIQAEGAFGVLKQDYSFRRFLCRGKANVKTEFTLLAIAYNIKKLAAKVSQNRQGISLFELKTG